MFDNTDSDVSFLVRSTADPRDFWHVPGRGPHVGTLLVSRTDRTRFRITARDAPAPLNGSPIILIGSDTVEITEAKTGRVVGIDSQASKQLVVEERGEGTLEPGLEVALEGLNAQIYFKDLKTSFSALSEDGDKSVARRLVVGDGEEWELV
ncbi:hypothetical protein CONPUDRAFT_155718 [Coniophora puteana RWD-64-598 SS2]|uniref:Uncharacterized protein n=1 Tax=Coniophora puteana (strain RWD-64-598) TaxID=741705 RepID=A0A5M3MIF8_CONPW|nr:uncharacterized protein CONPUDRAFT_155718 [Coniophora puteana RWD-64-598 SS2]EIW79029.1 hypothetical protein CONPUDRAFT_155718 [Coniophora puteana RWD-64-598 SS2]